MKLRRRFSSSLRTLAAHRMKSALALSGVAAGVAALVLVRAISEGAQLAMDRAIEQLGTNLLIVKPLPVRRLVSRPEISGYATSLTSADGAAITALDSVRVTAPAMEGAVRVKLGATTTMTTLRGTTADYPAVRRFRLAGGRFFDGADDLASRRVAVLGARVSDALADGGSTVGQPILIGNVPFVVIGVLAPKGTSVDGGDEDNQVLVPLRTALRRVFNASWLTAIYVSVTDPARMSDAETEIQRLVRARHRRGVSDSGTDFAVQNTAQTRTLQRQITASLGRYGLGLSAIALLVGGIGIMALMFLAVRERTNEIGLRMAVGAQPLDVVLQFLIEATALSLAGWGTGVVMAALSMAALMITTTWTIAIPVGAILGSLVLSAAIGIGFGGFPARQAARIPPIQALLRT